MGGGMYVAGSVVNSDDSLQKATSGQAEEYDSGVIEVGYTVAPGLTAKVTHIDYDYKRGSNTLASGDDNGSATRFTLTASF